MFTSEASDTSARWLTSNVLDTGAFIVTESVAQISTVLAGSIKTWLAFAFEVAGFRDEEAVRIGVTVHFGTVHLAWVSTFCFAGLKIKTKLIISS